jgi:phage terminase large subunit GpA-like protein
MSVQRLVSEISRRWAPPEKMTVSAWADEYRFLSSESGAAAGKWHTLPFQREIFDSFSTPSVHSVVVMCATQLVKTVLIENVLGFIIDRDPGPTLLIVPRDLDGDRFSKIRLAPMVRDTQCLRDKVVEVKTARTTNTLDYKGFPGGHLTIAAAGSPGNLAALPIRYLLCDEIDKYPASSGSEGDPISLALKRTATFWNRKVVLCCSPTIDGESRIAKAFAGSDQREYTVPCHACGSFQALKWGQVKWDNGLATKEARAASAYYECEHCQARWNDVERWRAVEIGRWLAGAPFAGVAGFHINELSSPWKKLCEIVLDFLTKKDDPEQLKTFVNTTLAETWKQGETPDWEKVYARREDYPLGTVPMRALMLVAAVDVQHNRLEVELVAYAPNRESWSVWYEVIPGDPANITAAGPWAALDELLGRDWPHESGGSMPILAMAIDTGFQGRADGQPAPVYEFARRHPQPDYGPAGTRVRSFRTVIPVKGNADAFKLISGVTGTDAAQKRQGVRIWAVGTHWAKQEFYDLLRLTPLDGGSFPPGYCHFPLGYEKVYFQGLCSERRVVRASGKVEWEEDSSVRNEPLDLRGVYARAAAELCDITRLTKEHWAFLESVVTRRPAPLRQAEIAVAAQPPLPVGEPRYIGRFDVTNWLGR